jgi:hypothetical protein
MKQDSTAGLLVISEAHALCLPQKGFSPKFSPVPFSRRLFASDLRSYKDKLEQAMRSRDLAQRALKVGGSSHG